jgi:hypothetical protein
LILDPSEMANIADEWFVPKIAVAIGAGPGTDALKKLLLTVGQVHRAITTERINHGLVVVCTFYGDEPCMPGAFASFTNAAALTAYFDGQTTLTVQVAADGLRVWTVPFDTMPDHDLVGYRYSQPHDENVFTRDAVYVVPPIASSPSYFGIPYFLDLRRALEQYGQTWIRYSSCEIFNAAWLDPYRLVFSPKPEVQMRRSMQRHLRSCLREHIAVAVMPEQNVNESRPVDIKVTWPYNRVALIEIKWLGKSAREGESSVTQEHFASRARDGSNQLADYLDLYHKELPHEEARGYLAVYDARRRRVSLPPRRISEADAAHYRYEEIDYHPDVLARTDFEHPIRFFCEAAI